jgi:3-phenylpropionate/trans-cinnamate dioxygenase ferredoxin subunit
MKHPVGSLDEFAPGSITIIELGSRSIGIINAAGKLYAVLNICPHALAPVCQGRLTGTALPSPPGKAVWGLENRILRCPWHGYEYDLEDQGRTVFTNFKARLRMFPVAVEDRQVYVEIAERATPTRRSPAAGQQTPAPPAQRSPAADRQTPAPPAPRA